MAHKRTLNQIVMHSTLFTQFKRVFCHQVTGKGKGFFVTFDLIITLQSQLTYSIESFFFFNTATTVTSRSIGRLLNLSYQFSSTMSSVSIEIKSKLSMLNEFFTDFFL